MISGRVSRALELSVRLFFVRKLRCVQGKRNTSLGLSPESLSGREPTSAASGCMSMDRDTAGTMKVTRAEIQPSGQNSEASEYQARRESVVRSPQIFHAQRPIVIIRTSEQYRLIVFQTSDASRMNKAKITTTLHLNQSYMYLRQTRRATIQPTGQSSPRLTFDFRFSAKTIRCSFAAIATSSVYEKGHNDQDQGFEQFCKSVESLKY